MAEEELTGQQALTMAEQKVRLSQLKRRRGGHKSTVTKLLADAQVISQTGSTDSATIDRLQQIVERIRQKQKDIAAINERLFDIIDLVDPDSIEQEMEETERAAELHAEDLWKLEKLIENFTKPLKPVIPLQTTNLSSQAKPKRDNVKLPKLNIPDFDGCYKSWTSFWDLFQTSVDANKSLSRAEKLSYLKSFLKGEPARMTSALQITDADYDVACKVLQERYNNERSIVRAHTAALLNYPALKQESAAALRNLQCEVSENLFALEAKGFFETRKDPLVLNLVADKHDHESSRQWELSLKGNDVPTLDKLLTFIDHRARALEILPRKEKPSITAASRPAASSKHMSYHQQEQPCPVCNAGEHRDKFLAMTSEPRYAEVLRLKLCGNCLQPGHLKAKCPSKRNCKTCNRRHNSLLHKENTSNTVGHAQVMLTNDNVQTILGTVEVSELGNGGKWVPMRSLLDSGSTINMITEQTTTTIRAVGQMHRSTSQKRDQRAITV